MTSKLPVSYRQAGAELRPASEVFPTSKTEVVTRGNEALLERRSAKDEAKLRERMTPHMKKELDSFEPSLRDAIFTYYEGGLMSLQLAMKFLEYHPVLQGMFAYDTYADSMVREKDIPDLDLPIGGNVEFCRAAPVTYNDQINLIAWLGLYGIMVKKELFMAQLEKFAKKYFFNPIQELLENFQSAWDGEPRLDTFFSRVFHKEDNPYYQELGKRFMIGAIGRALANNNRPYKFDWMPVLSGGQGLGKSMFCRALFGSKYLRA